AGGTPSIWNQPVPGGTTGDARGKAAQWHELELGYGLPGLKGRGLWHPFVGTRANQGGGRSVRMGVRLTIDSMLDAAFEIGRREQAHSEADHSLQLRGSMRW
ncbi:MAG: hypothetical protein OXE40_02010, partial [Gammaproteobacteria bacterium]|nr:hypothetical protein [Gammaproteobacteria bacterium]